MARGSQCLHTKRKRLCLESQTSRHWHTHRSLQIHERRKVIRQVLCFQQRNRTLRERPIENWMRTATLSVQFLAQASCLSTHGPGIILSLFRLCTLHLHDPILPNESAAEATLAPSPFTAASTRPTGTRRTPRPSTCLRTWSTASSAGWPTL